MDAQVRKSLMTLQGLLDEGFITHGEFNQRRKAIIDGVTSVDDAAPAKSSVFSRLGAGVSEPTGTTGGGGDAGKWQHDGFQELYGGRKVSVVGGKKAAQPAIRKPLAGAISKSAKADLRARLTGGGGGDLRSKLSGGGGGGGSSGGGGKAKMSAPQPFKKQLPSKCPW